VQVKHGSSVVGMGRLIGDGGLNFDVVDIAVAPEHQGFDDLFTDSRDPSAYITLMADVPALYEKFGFVYRSPESEGIY
jgi:hypothetical protein